MRFLVTSVLESAVQTMFAAKSRVVFVSATVVAFATLGGIVFVRLASKKVKVLGKLTKK
jgi:hypothetical protein